jgi:hypothetical protein
MGVVAAYYGDFVVIPAFVGPDLTLFDFDLLRFGVTLCFFLVLLKHKKAPLMGSYPAKHASMAARAVRCIIIVTPADKL